MPIRRPQVAGTFYPSDPALLEKFCKSRLPGTSPLQPARAVILPHAGYRYSGETACRVLARVEVPGRVLLIGPNHRGVGADFAVVTEGEWETPLGRVPVDAELAQGVAASAPLLTPDWEAHAAEHSLEVLVPLLQTKNPAAKIAPLIVGTLDLESAREAALGIADFLLACRETPLLVISTDMNHYESDAATRKKDPHALEAIRCLDAEGLAAAVRRFHITMCGFVPVYMLLVMAEKLGIRKAELVDYRTSACASGDFDRVVGYAGFILG